MQKASIEKIEEFLPPTHLVSDFFPNLGKTEKNKLENLKQNESRDEEKEEFILRKTIMREKWTKIYYSKRGASQTRVGKLRDSVTRRRSSGSENMLGTRNMAVNKNGQG